MPLIKRHLANRILASLGVSPVVFLNGPRQAGKSTLVRNLAENKLDAEYVSFDSPTQMAAATASPESFLKGRKPTFIIDEVQMVPELFRALKTTVDELRISDKENAYGRFLLTGSANILALPKLADPLVGRMSVLTLYPLSASEALGGQGVFVEHLFNQAFKISDSLKKDLVDVIKRATFPEISGIYSEARTIWFDGYITTILQRDVRMLADLEKITLLPNILKVLASRAGKLINDADLAREIGLNPVTSQYYRNILKMMFLNFDLRPWYRNITKRLVKSSKGFLVDTLLLAHMLDIQIDNLQQSNPAQFGHLLENFVASELMKLLALSDHRIQLYHFRTSDNKEVDFVLEKADGRLAGIEVKSRENINADDFKGLKELKALVGKDFVTGIVLYPGMEIIPFGENLWAVPIGTLWQ